MPGAVYQQAASGGRQIGAGLFDGKAMPLQGIARGEQALESIVRHVGRVMGAPQAPAQPVEQPGMVIAVQLVQLLTRTRFCRHPNPLGLNKP